MAMYGQLGEAMTQGIIAQMNPMNGIVREMAAKQLTQLEDELIRTTATTVEIIEQKLEAAKERQASASVIGAYEKLLARAYGNS